MKDASLNWPMLLPAAAAVAASAGLLVYWLRRRPDDPDDIERQRRAYLNKIGRICEGQVIEIVECSGSSESRPSAPSRRPQGTRPDALGRKLVCYSYSISGVTYETAQDVTGLEQRLGLAALATGQSASVKYDPSNPSNSILVADDWSGLR